MPISVTCGACKKQFTVPDHYAGKTGKCTQCGAPILAPAAPIGAAIAPAAPIGAAIASATPVADAKLASDEMLAAMGAGPGAIAPSASEKIGVGSTLAGYKLQKRLGGERSSVFLAQGPNGPAAIKVLPSQVTQSSPTAAKRFLREARSLFGLSHPNVVSCLDAGEELGTLYLVMELFSGRTVRDLIAERGGKVPTTEALEIALHVARGLAHLGEQKLVHRNIMPEHILVGPDGTAKIIGLGLVKGEEQEQAVTMKGIAVGTPQYMSPELATGGAQLDARSDLWALGVTLYEMLAGEVPWFDKHPLKLLQKVQNDPPPPLREKNATVSPTAVLVVEKLLAKDKEARYEAATVVAEDLEAIKEGTLIQGKPPSFVAAAAAKNGAGHASSATRAATSKLGRSGDASAPQGDPLVKKLLFAVVGLGVLVLALLVVVVVLLLRH